jgi:hypothetical protein
MCCSATCLARLYDHGDALGYMSPDIFDRGRATTATDVEVACGRRAIDPVTGFNLLRWVSPGARRKGGTGARRGCEASRVLRR